MHARVVIAIALAACAAPARPAPAPLPAPEPAPAPPALAAEPPAPAPRPPPRSRRSPGTVVMLDELDGSPASNPRREDLAQKKSDLWDPCVRDVLQGRRAELREPLGDALAQVPTTCDRATHTVTFEPPRSGRAYATGSHVGIAGVLTPSTTELVVRVVTRGHAAERLTILAGGARWTSPPLEVTHDAAWGRDLAGLPYTRSLARVLRRMLDTDGALLRFESPSGIEDVPVTEEMATDLRAMLDVVDEL